MDIYTWSLILSVIFNFIVSVSLLVLFCTLKKYRCNPNTEHKYNIFVAENSLKFKDLCLKVFSTGLEEIKQECGEEAHHYLYITRTLAILITVLCPITEAILIPVYQQGKLFTQELLIISIVNIFDREELLVAPFIVFVVFILSSYFILKVFVAETLKSSSCTSLNSSAFRIVRLPQNMPNEKMMEEITSCLNLHKENVYIVPNLSKAIEYERLLKNANEELLHYTDVEHFKNKREKIRLKFYDLKKVDAIDHWDKQVKELTIKRENEYKNSKNSNSGVCIVKNMPESNLQDCIRRIQGKYRMARVTTLVVNDDLKWENIENDEESAKNKHTLHTLIFFCIFFIFFTPSIFLALVISTIKSIGLGSALEGFITAYAPNILMLVYQLAIVPASVKYLVNKEKHYSKSAEVVSSMRKFLIFYLFNMLFVPALGMSVVGILNFALIAGDFEILSKVLGFLIFLSSLSFVSVMLTQTFIVNISNLAQLGKIIEMKYKALRAVSERELFNAYEPEQFNYAQEYSILVTCFSIVLLYSIVYPIILIFGCVYLWFRYFVHKYNIMCFFSKDYVKSHASTIVVKTIAINVVIFQWYTCFIIMLFQYDEYEILCTLIFVTAIVFLILFWVKYDRLRNSKIKVKCDQLIDEKYKHPLEEKCNAYLLKQETKMQHLFVEAIN